MNKAQQLRKQAEEVQAAEKQRQIDESRKELKAMQNAMERDTPRFVNHCLTEAEAAALRGKTTAAPSIAGEVAYRAAKQVAKELEAQGFSVIARPLADHTSMDVEGYGGYTTYSCTWHLSW